jgi:protein-S-isoprenylcysteine O-methyltransferase Ste14
MKDKKMTRWGCGPKIVRRTLLVAVVVYVLQYFFFPNFKIPISQNLAYIIGGIWFALGIPVWFLGGFEVHKSFSKGRLVTSGIFRYIQHPIYAAFCWFYLPGFVFMTRSIVGFVLPFVFYFFLTKFISFEEEYLEKLFGKEYLEYKKGTGRIFPRLIG